MSMDGNLIICFQCYTGNHRYCEQSFTEYDKQFGRDVERVYRCECVEGDCITWRKQQKPSDGNTEILYE
jgi:hypothetical protein